MGGALALAAGTAIGQRTLSHVPRGVVMVSRALIGAAVVMGESPTGGQLLGGAISAVGMGLGAMALWWGMRRRAAGGVGFRGV